MASIFLALVIMLSGVLCLKGEEELVLVNEDGDSVDSQGRFPGHVVLRPDYTFWNMVNAIRNMFDMRTEKRWQRDCE
uniref:U7-Nephitoxin-Nsp1a_1 n=1 Tax=Heterorhabditis bacteriophora TaxID=37862 RepID=A0A1I7XV12_HETBA